MDAENAQPALERIDIDHEHVPDDMLVRIRLNGHFHGIIAFALVEYGWITFQRVRHQALENVKQFGNARTGRCRHKTDGDQVTFAQRLFERFMQLFRLQVLSLLEIDLHQFFVDFHHLVDDSLVSSIDGIKRRLGAVWLKKTIDNTLALGIRKIDRQAFRAKGFPNIFDETGQIYVFGINLVYDDHAAKSLRFGRSHHTSCYFFDA